jgi:cytochrome c oxidase assembly protein subunit 15
LRGTARSGALALAAAVTLQAALGIATLLAQAPLALALAHQAMAMIVLTFAVLHAQRMGEGVRIPAPDATAAGKLGAMARV